MRDALSAMDDVVISEVNEDNYIPKHRGKFLRAINRALSFAQKADLMNAINICATRFRPNVIVAYKGTHISSKDVRNFSKRQIPTVNIFPDNSPHAQGRALKKAVGAYDLVISTKPFHPKVWRSAYGYINQCVCVPHGYDPKIHLWPQEVGRSSVDVALCATWREEYEQLILQFLSAASDCSFSISIAGSGWDGRRQHLPHTVEVVGPVIGRAYGEFLRSAKIVIAPVNLQQPSESFAQFGDVDTTRTYELAAMHCFFLHQRTDYISSVYDEHTEVPFWSDASELAALVKRWLPDDLGRLAMASRAHARAVPAYSIPERAKDVLRHIERVINTKQSLGWPQ
jgi:spore maturation protein CgeB